MTEKKEKGFTLVELLVVISIISLLSSVVYASVSSARDKAQIATGQQFSSNIEHGFRANSEAYYSFDGATQVADSIDGSQYSRNLTFSGTPDYSEAGQKGDAIRFDGSNYAYTDANISIGANDSWTISAWIKPANIATNPIFLSFVSPFYFRVVSRNFYAYFPSGPLLESNGGRKDGVWYHVAVTHKYSASSPQHTNVLYVNGKEARRHLGVPTGFSNLRMYIGSHAGNYRFSGVIDEVFLTKETLLASDIQKLYAEGLPTHTLAKVK